MGEMFENNLQSFGVLLKGCSLSCFPEYSSYFDDCFIVNDFDDEVQAVGSSLAGKKVCHFVNRSRYAPLSLEDYNNLGITEIQLYQSFNAFDVGLLKAWLRYKLLNRNIHWLPDALLKFNEPFGPEFKAKFPNTGVLAVIYALEIIRPKQLWVFGMDFYQSEYYSRREYHESLTPQKDKYERLGMIEYTAKLFSNYPEVDVKLVTSYDKFPDVENVERIIVSC